MPRLLPIWSEYSAALNLDAKEPLETFGWMKDPTDYEDMCQALKAAEATEWLKNYPPPKDGFFPFNEPIAHKVAANLKGLPNHSGSSMMCLFRAYQDVLNNWDACVLALKTRQARATYDAEQIDYLTLTRLNKMAYLTTLHQTDEMRHVFKSEIAKFSPEGTLDETLVLVQELYKEMRLERIKAEDERFNGQLEVLEFQYNNPQRWFNNSLFGPPQNILQHHMEAMEDRHPGYRQHIAEIIARQKIEAGHEY